MPIDTTTLAKAFAEAARQRKESGEPLYIAQVPDGRYVGYDCKLVKTKASAMRLFNSPDKTNWQHQVPYWTLGCESFDELDLTITQYKYKRTATSE